jgi:hypothetical protein
MPECPDCGRGIPDLQTRCKECYAARYTVPEKPGRSKSFRERLTRDNVIFFLAAFAFAFLEFRFDTRRWIPPFTGAYHTMPTKTAVLTACVFALLAFYWESGRRS